MLLTVEVCLVEPPCVDTNEGIESFESEIATGLECPKTAHKGFLNRRKAGI